MTPNLKTGSIVLPLLLVLATAGFFFVKNLTARSFTESQANVQSNINDRFNPFSSKYVASLSKHMGKIESWDTHTNEKFNYKVKHPNVWNEAKRDNPPATLDYFEVALSNKVSFSVTVQNTFVVSEKTPKIQAQSGDFYFYQDESHAKSAVNKKDALYYIIHLKENGYFANEQEFKGTFYQLLNNFEFLN